MPQHTEIFDGAIVHFSTTDAVFRTLNKKPIMMEFHRYLGPQFSLDGEDWSYMPDEDSLEWDNLWEQFAGWDKARIKKEGCNVIFFN